MNAALLSLKGPGQAAPQAWQKAQPVQQTQQALQKMKKVLQWPHTCAVGELDQA
jgi:hypothetical protein